MRLPVKHYVKKFSGDAIDLNGWAPPIRDRPKIGDDGEIIKRLEKLPSIGCIKMVHPHGDVIHWPAYCGAGKFAPSDGHRVQLESEKLEKGWLPYAVCPKMIGLAKWLPKNLRDTPPCKSTKNAEGLTVPIDDEHPCECIEAVIKVRQAAAAKETKLTNERRKSDDSRRLEVQTDQVSKLTDLITHLQANAGSGDGDKAAAVDMLAGEVERLKAEIDSLKSRGKK